ncbi:MAG: hypothetical protein NTX55_01880 [Candidatus Parcubacteria bacterium]|nr:hypothetical protein [Candidatus Parcubacteria bacterium]
MTSSNHSSIISKKEKTGTMSVIIEIATSPVMTLVVTLLFFFQWYKQHAREQSIKYSLFSIRRILSRVLKLGTGLQNTNAQDLIDYLDAILATLGARPSFIEKLREVVKNIKTKIKIESREKIESLPTEDKTEAK